MALQKCSRTVESTLLSYFIICMLFLSLAPSELATCERSGTNNYGDCNVLLERFALQTASFTHCAIVNAQPIRLCESCVKQYLSVTQVHADILKLQDNTGQKCKEKLTNLDRLGIVERGFTYVDSLWMNGHCNYCFETSNGTLVPEITNNTLKFEDIHRETNNCIQKHYNATSKKYNSTVCETCSSLYGKMNAYYSSLTGNGHYTCIDVIDSMNATRRKWSGMLSCGKKTIAVEGSLCASIILVMLTPVIFYIAAKMNPSEVKSRVIQQKRLIERLTCPSTSDSVLRQQ